MKNKNTLIYSVVGGALAVIIVAALIIVGIQGNSSQNTVNNAKTNETKITDVMASDSKAMHDDKMADKNDVMSTGLYTDYDQAKIMAASSNNRVVLFFKASWCPTCNTFDKDVNANLTSIPKNVTILKIDYDNSTDLKKKYGITYQHTFVEVDKDGNQIKKWSGSLTLKNFIDQIS